MKREDISPGPGVGIGHARTEEAKVVNATCIDPDTAMGPLLAANRDQEDPGVLNSVAMVGRYATLAAALLVAFPAQGRRHRLRKPGNLAPSLSESPTRRFAGIWSRIGPQRG